MARKYQLSHWLPACSVIIRMFFFGGVLKANSVILKYTVAKLNTSTASVACAFTLQSSVAYLLTPLGGKILLRYMSFRKLGVVGGLFAGLGYVGSGLLVTSNWHLYVLYALTGVGFAVIRIPNFVYAHIHYKEHFGGVYAMAIAFTYVGVAVLPLTQQWLIDLFGYEGGITCFGGLVWNCVIVGVLMPHTEHTRSYVEQIRRPMPPGELHFCEKYLPVLSPFLRHNEFVVLTVFGIVGMLVYSSWAIFLVSFGEAQGLSTHEAVLISTVGGVGGTIGSLAAAVIFHLRKMNAVTCYFLPNLINGIALLLSVFISQFEVFAFLMFVSGFAQGFLYAALCGIVPEIVCGYHVESAYGCSSLTRGASFQLGGLISGLILDYTGEMRYILLACSVLSILVTPLSFLWMFHKSSVPECYPRRSLLEQ